MLAIVSIFNVAEVDAAAIYDINVLPFGIRGTQDSVTESGRAPGSHLSPMRYCSGTCGMNLHEYIKVKLSTRHASTGRVISSETDEELGLESHSVFVDACSP